MRRDCRHRFPLVSILLLFSTLSYGQAWSGILAPSRAIDWSHAGLPATLPDGETTPNPWTPPIRTQCGSTLNPSGSDDTSAINSAISSCTSAHYVLLGSGSFQVGGKIALDGARNMSLRGSGAQSTKLLIGSGGSITIGDANGTGSANWTTGSNVSQGSTSIVVTGSQVPVGAPAWLAQCDTGTSGSGCATGSEGDNGSVWICGFQTICSNQNASGSKISEQQNVFVTAVSGTCSSSCTVTFTPGLHMPNWALARSPTISWNDPHYTAIGMAIEDLTIDFHSGTNNYGSFTFQQAYASWVKGVRFIGASASGCCMIDLATDGDDLFMNNYIFGQNPVSAAGAGLSFQHGSESDDLILNNLMQGGGISNIEGAGHDSGVVLAYIYARDTAVSQVYNGDAEHSPSPNFILREANQWGPSEDDGTWGTHNFDTWFRNYVSCYDPPFIGEAAPRGILIDNYARFENVVGNVLGSSSNCTNYSGTGSDLNEVGFGGSDPLAESTSMRWGNYSNATGTVHWTSSEVPSGLPSPNTAYSNPVPSNQNLPASFFLPTTAHPSGGTGLNWWKVCTTWTTFPTSCSATQTQPFPPIGPDVTGGGYDSGYAYDIPAAVAYKTLPIDATYQNSYTITGSSWSSGTETLNVSGLPNSNGHTMGGFQVSGVAGACLPTSGVSYTGRSDGEILMTGSSATTISYALASNPGTNCTGTMRWPDVRQFDELVYENDPDNGDPPNPPTGLSAVVQ
jgi:hypothetical protein